MREGRSPFWNREFGCVFLTSGGFNSLEGGGGGRGGDLNASKGITCPVVPEYKNVSHNSSISQIPPFGYAARSR